MAQLKVTYKKSTIGYAHDQKRTVASLGLRRLNQTVLLPDNDAVRGMVFKVRHLVSVEEVAGDDAPSRPAPVLRPAITAVASALEPVGATVAAALEPVATTVAAALRRARIYGGE